MILLTVLRNLLSVRLDYFGVEEPTWRRVGDFIDKAGFYLYSLYNCQAIAETRKLERIFFCASLVSLSWLPAILA